MKKADVELFMNEKSLDKRDGLNSAKNQTQKVSLQMPISLKLMLNTLHTTVEYEAEPPSARD